LNQSELTKFVMHFAAGHKTVHDNRLH